ALFAQPVIVSPPQWQTNAVGWTAIFSVVATGAPPLFYQWRFNGQDRAGATNDALVLTNVQTTNQGIYTIVVTNQAGATSAAARLYVVTLPVITRHPTPTNQSVSVGANATFTAAATASSVVHTNYEWRHGDGSFTKVTAGSPVNDGGE